MNIRPAYKNDATILSVLCITVWIDTYALEGIEQAFAEYVLSEFSSENIECMISDQEVYIAEIDKRPVGLIIFKPSNGEIATLYVLPKFKQRGIGSALIKVIRDKALSKIFLTCWEGNQDAIDFYCRQGFEKTGETFFHLDGKDHRNIVFTIS